MSAEYLAKIERFVASFAEAGLFTIHEIDADGLTWVTFNPVRARKPTAAKARRWKGKRPQDRMSAAKPFPEGVS
jgi:hypothetical protein